MTNVGYAYMGDGEARKRYETAFARLKKSKFRSRFRLSEADRKYVADKGMDTIRSHCEDFVRMLFRRRIRRTTESRPQCADIPCSLPNTLVPAVAAAVLRSGGRFRTGSKFLPSGSKASLIS